MTRFKVAALSLAVVVATGCGGSSQETLPADTVAPTVKTIEPADGQVVGTGQKLRIEFSEQMNEATVTANVADGGGGTYVLGSPTWTARTTLSFNTPPAPFSFAASYQVVVEGRDLSGNALDGTRTFSFAVAPQPALVAFAPVDGAADVARESRPKATFNQAMDRASVESALTVQASSTPVACLFAWSTDSTEVTCVPPADFAFGASVTVAVAASARSAVGDLLVSPASAAFAVAAAPVPPAVASASPPGGTTDAGLGTAVVITFSKPMNLASAQTAFSTSPVTTGTFTWDPSDTVMTYRPAAAFAHGTAVTWTVSTAAQDKGGLAMLAAASGGFHVVRETTVTINRIANQSGYLVGSSVVAGGNLIAGDSFFNLTYRAFASFLLAANLPPTTKTITSAVLQTTANLPVGSPFSGALGSFKAQGVFYDTLDTGDWDVATDGFSSPRPCKIIKFPILAPETAQPLRMDASAAGGQAIVIIPIDFFCPYEWTETSGSFSQDVTGKVQADFRDATARKGLSQFRLRFTTDTDGNSTSDNVSVPTVQLVVTAEYGW